MSGFWKRAGITLGVWVLGTACLALWAGRAKAEERLALVIGNDAYAGAARLANPVRDARAMATVLREAKFRVTAVEDATGHALAEAVDGFGRAVAAAGPDAVALVYYAGHAAQLDGVNYLLPVDVPLGGETALKAGALGVEDILKRLDAAGARARLVILDACRNNPFQDGASGPRGLAVDGPLAQARGEGGLTRLDTGIGTLVAFATAPGAVAADGTDGHSPYTAALLSLIREPGLPVEALFRRARLAVHTATGGTQVPWESSSLTGAFSFFPGPAPEAVADGLSPEARAVLAAGPDRARLQALGPDAAHALAIHLGTPEALRLYVAAFPSEPRAQVLYALIDGLARETAWVWALRENSRAALYAYRLLYPAGMHEAEIVRLLPLRPETRPVLASLCPPAAPLLPPAGPAPRGGKAREPAPHRRADTVPQTRAALPPARAAAKPALPVAPPAPPRPAIRASAAPDPILIPPRRIVRVRPLPEAEVRPLPNREIRPLPNMEVRPLRPVRPVPVVIREREIRERAPAPYREPAPVRRPGRVLGEADEQSLPARPPVLGFRLRSEMRPERGPAFQGERGFGRAPLPSREAPLGFTGSRGNGFGPGRARMF